MQMCIVQGNNLAELGFEPRTLNSESFKNCYNMHGEQDD